MSIILKNTQIAKEFKVSHTTVTNWIEATKKGQNNLELATIGKRYFIIDSLQNREILYSLANRAKNYLWALKKQEVKVKKEFYEIFSYDQICEIISNLTGLKEIPYKFTYLNRGAELWEKHYLISLNNQERVVTKERQLISENLENILFKFKKYCKINIFDIGCGNGLPVIPIIKRLLESHSQVTYTAIDISPMMIEIDKKQLLNNFPNLDYRSEVLDFDFSNLSELFIESKIDKSCVNLILHLGGTLGNQNDVHRIYANFKYSMGINDYLILGAGLENYQTKATVLKPHNEYHSKRTTWIIDLMGLKGCYDDNLFDVYDSQNKEYIRKVKINKDVNIIFNLDDKNLTIDLTQGEEIVVSRFKRFKEIDLISNLLSYNFAIDHFISSEDNSYSLALVRHKTVK